MTYREKLELYSQGKLDEQQKIEIEQDLEKQEALADYLFEHQAPPGMDDLFDEEPAFGAKAAGGNDSNAKASITENDLITKQINWSIRKAFIKTGVVAVIIAIAISLFITLALPRIVSAFYYDPEKEDTVGTGDDAYTVYQLEKDMDALLETRIPELGTIYADISDLGYGKYRYEMESSFRVFPNYDGEYFDVIKTLTGEIRKNAFYSDEPNELSNYAVKQYESYFPHDSIDEESKNKLDSMDSHSLYYVYVSLKREMPYEKFFSEYAENESIGTFGSWVWCRVLPSEYYANFIGFYARADSMTLGRQEYDNSRDTEEMAIKHFRKLVKRLNNSGFGEKILSFDNIYLGGLGKYEDYLLSKNGLDIQDFIYVSDKEHIEKLREDKNVAHITIKEVE